MINRFSSINIETKILYKTLSYRIQQLIEKIISHNQVDLFKICKPDSTFDN